MSDLLAQHPHLCYTCLILVLTLNRPTLRTIQQRWFDCCPVKLSFQLNLRIETERVNDISNNKSYSLTFFTLFDLFFMHAHQDLTCGS